VITSETTDSPYAQPVMKLENVITVPERFIVHMGSFGHWT